MVTFRSRRLETLLGAPLDEVSADAIHNVVTNAITEAVDLEFKVTTYGGSETAKRNLAVDVAAIANAAGGLIILGVKENKLAQAEATPGVEITDAERTRMLSIIASQVSPMPVVDIISVYDEPGGAVEGARHGFWLIAVARTALAPHAVVVNESLRFPVRNGTSTRYLSEPEVAAAIVDRAAGRAARRERLILIEKEARGRRDRDADLWIFVSLVPDVPGNSPITSAGLDALRQTIGRPMMIGADVEPARRRVGVAKGRYIIDDTTTATLGANGALLELHEDGSGVYALRSLNLANDDRRWPAELLLVDDESITLAALSGLEELGAHAQQAGASGLANIRAKLVPTDRAYQLIALGSLRPTGNPRELGGDRLPTLALDLPAAEAIADLDDLAPTSAGLVAAAAALVNQLAQTLGVAQLGQISTEGTLDATQWTKRWATRALVMEWARDNGISIIGLAAPPTT